MGVFDQHATGLAFDAANAPGSVTQQHDVARIAFDGEVFVQRANDNAFGLGNHCEQCCLWNRAAAGDGCKAGTPARAEFAIDAIVMQVRTIAPPAGRNPFGEHFDDRIEEFAGEIAVGVGSF